MKRTIVLYGAAAKRFGKKHVVNADTVVMLFRGLFHKLGKGIGSEGEALKELIGANSWHVFKNDKKDAKTVGNLQVNRILEDDIHTLHMVPVIAGAGGALEVVLGIAIIAVAVISGQTWAIGIGASMVLGGIAQLISPHPSTSNSNGGLTSYDFSGPTNPDSQGEPVPLVYGAVGNCGGVMISIGLSYAQT